MKPSIPFSSVALCLLKPGISEAQLHLPFTRHMNDLATIVGRDSNPAETLHGGDYLYLVNATFGTPGQNVALVISPSTPDTWVPTPDSCLYSSWDYTYGDDGYTSLYNETVVDLCGWGSYNASLSTTNQQAVYKYQDWYAWQPDGTFISGTNVTDTVKLGDIEVKDFIFAAASEAQGFVGLLGLGFNSSYSNYDNEYANFPDRLLQQGVIATKAYSIWLDDEGGTSGSLLLGAIDTARFDGILTRLDSYSPFTGAFGVTVTSINGSDNAWASSMADEFPLYATIGHGQTFSNFPDFTAKAIWAMAGATYNSTIQLATIPCDAASAAGQVDASLFKIQFSGYEGPVLDIHLSDLILPQSVAMYAWNGPSTDRYAVPIAPPGTCLFAVQNGSTFGDYASASSNYNNIGASLLRQSYMVFDAVNNEVAIAPVKFGTTETSTVVPFQSYGATVPQATKYCAYGSYCDGKWVGDGGDGGSSSDPSGSGSSSGDGPSSNGPGVIIGLSVAFGLLTLVSALVAIAVWRKTCCGPGDKSGKEVDTDADNDTGLPAMTQALPVPSHGGNPGGSTLPTVYEEMTDVSGSLAQLPPHKTPRTGDIGESQAGEMSTGPRTIINEGQPSHLSPTEPSTPAISKGKGRDSGLADEAQQ